MRTIHDWFESYGADHRNATNRAVHWVCVPAILWSVIAALWVVPVPVAIGKPGLWCALVMVAAPRLTSRCPAFRRSTRAA